MYWSFAYFLPVLLHLIKGKPLECEDDDLLNLTTRLLDYQVSRKLWYEFSANPLPILQLSKVLRCESPDSACMPRHGSGCS